MQTNTRQRGQDGRSHNQQSLFRVGLMFAIAFLLASSMPQPLMAAALSSLLSLSALVSAGLAAFMGDRLHASHFTRWDEAAAMLFASMVAGAFVDQEALAEAAAYVRS